jgi:hypothetical protein
MMAGRVMFGKIIRQIKLARPPINMKLPLAHTVPNTIKTHINGARALLAQIGVGNPAYRRIIRLDWGSGLGILHLLQNSSQYHCCFSIVEQGTDFCLRC